MSYNSIYQSSNDVALMGRVTAAAAQEGADSPSAAMYELIWDIVTTSDIALAYESALLQDHPNPGGDESVITDQMILSAVQAHWTNVTPPALQPTT